MHQRCFLLNAGDAAGLIEQGIVEIQRRPHMHQYALSMHMIATRAVSRSCLLCRRQTLSQFDAHSPRVGQECSFQVRRVGALLHGPFEFDTFRFQLLI